MINAMVSSKTSPATQAINTTIPPETTTATVSPLWNLCGTVAVVADTQNYDIKILDLASGAISSVVGSGVYGYQDGDRTSAQFNYPLGVAETILDGRPISFVADAYGDHIRRVDLLTGSVSSVMNAWNPTGLVVSPDGKSLYFCLYDSHQIGKLNIATGEVVILSGSHEGFRDGSLATAQYKYPRKVSMSFDGSIIVVSDHVNHAIRILNISDDNVYTLAGNGQPGFLNGIGSAARFQYPAGTSVSSDYDFILVADHHNHAIRKIETKSGAVSTLAGGILGAGFADGEGTSARFYYPAEVAITLKDGILVALVADRLNDAIRVVSLENAVVSTLSRGSFYWPDSVSVLNLAPCEYHYASPTTTPMALTPGASHIAHKMNSV